MRVFSDCGDRIVGRSWLDAGEASQQVSAGWAANTQVAYESVKSGGGSGQPLLLRYCPRLEGRVWNSS
jgi:hypothetical protein